MGNSSVAAAMPESDYSVDEEQDEGSYDLFEPGNPWSQKISTQIQRRNWRKSVYLEFDDTIPVDEVITQTSLGVIDSDNETNLEGEKIPATNTPATAIVIDDDDDDDEHLFEASTPRRNTDEAGGRGRTKDISLPWWSNGKTAPLLRDFDGNRRSFYMAQAGVPSSATPATPNQQRVQIIPQGATQTPTAITAMMTTSTTVTTPSSALRPTPLPVRKALSLAGNANSSTPGSLSSIAMTPRKKTWGATWGEKAAQQENENSTPNTNKKSKRDDNASKGVAARRGARGNGRGKRGRALGVTARSR